VDLKNRARRQASAKHRRISGIQMLGSEPVQTVLSQQWKYPVHGLRAVIGQCTWCQLLRQDQPLADHVEVFGHPFRQRWSTAWLDAPGWSYVLTAWPNRAASPAGFRILVL